MTPQQGGIRQEILDSQSNGSNITLKFYLFIWPRLISDSDTTM